MEYTKQQITAASKKLSLILRHQPALIELELDPQGWTDVNKLLSQAQQHNWDLTLPLLQTVVAQNNKQRFAFSNDGLRIRASQGHSLPIDLGYTPSTPPEVLYHGTATQYLDAILAQGLQKGKRHHVHLSKDLPTASQVGARHGQLVLLRIRATAMHQDGHLFYESANGVWLTDHVPANFIKVIIKS